MKWFPFLWLMLVLLLAGACSRPFCDNKAAVLIDKQVAKPIALDSAKSLLQLIDYLDYHHCTLGENYLYLNLDMKEARFVTSPGVNTIALPLEPPPCTNEEPQYDFDMLLEVLLDGNNLLIEGQRLAVDSLEPYVFYQYLNYGRRKGFSQVPYGNGIWLIGDKDTPVQRLAPLIKRLVTAYWQAMDAYVQATEGKALCELSPEGVRRLRNKIPFRLSLKFTNDLLPRLESDLP